MRRTKQRTVKATPTKTALTQEANEFLDSRMILLLDKFSQSPVVLTETLDTFEKEMTSELKKTISIQASKKRDSLLKFISPLNLEFTEYKEETYSTNKEFFNNLRDYDEENKEYVVSVSQLQDKAEEFKNKIMAIEYEINRREIEPKLQVYKLVKDYYYEDDEEPRL